MKTNTSYSSLIKPVSSLIVQTEATQQNKFVLQEMLQNMFFYDKLMNNLLLLNDSDDYKTDGIGIYDFYNRVCPFDRESDIIQFLLKLGVIYDIRATFLINTFKQLKGS